MAPQKSPAFSFYAKDFLSGTAKMSLQEIGAYIRLLAYAWDDGSIPADADERARLMVCSKSQERELWKRVGKKFVLRGDVYINERLEEERTKQTERRQRLADNGSKGGRPSNQKVKQDETNSFPAGKANENLDERLAFSSSSSSTVKAKNESASRSLRQRPIIESPREYDRKHGNHLGGFCDWCCFPMELVERFAKRIPGEDDGLKRAQIKQWADSIRVQWSDRVIPDGSDFDFWTNRWTETHGGSKPATATLKAVQTAHAIDEAFR